MGVTGMRVLAPCCILAAMRCRSLLVLTCPRSLQAALMHVLSLPIPRSKVKRIPSAPDALRGRCGNH
eukprot:5481550-Lingulodinium_polyedra.AAC.1